MKKSVKRLLAIAVAIFAGLGVGFGACALYVNDYYRADVAAMAALPFGQQVETYTTADGLLVFVPAEPKAGLIFYPGGKVEHTAYTPLMQACAEKGILCVLVEMPLRLAVLDMNAADGVAERFPAVESWYIGGHSLGGSMAASYAAAHTDAFDGLVLLGAYSTADLSAGEVAVLSVYGSEDTVMNADKYASYKENLPADFTELVIEGGCHAYFGAYGAQDGDGTPTVTNEEQISLTASTIAQFIF